MRSTTCRWGGLNRTDMSDDSVKVHGASQDQLVDRLLDHANEDGGWGYRPGTLTAAEPTAWACLALQLQKVPRNTVVRALRQLAGMQLSSGGVPVTRDVDHPCWTTPLAILAWLSADAESSTLFLDHVTRAASWLNEDRGIPVRNEPPLLGHNTQLIGWSWTTETHSWIEPTAYAVLALKALGEETHDRAREGVRLLLDRVLPEGGWNYGNPKVMGQTLRPFPATTGIVLTAIACEHRDASIDRSIGYLSKTLPTLRAPVSVAWALMGLSAWGARPADAAAHIHRALDRASTSAPNCHSDALLLSASAGTFPFQSTRIARIDD